MLTERDMIILRQVAFKGAIEYINASSSPIMPMTEEDLDPIKIKEQEKKEIDEVRRITNEFYKILVEEVK